jgi:hypothetical protein
MAHGPAPYTMGPPTDNIHQRLALLILIVGMNPLAMTFILGSDVDGRRYEYIDE